MGKVSIGTDPEALLFDTTTDRVVPAVGLIGGTKQKPLHYSKKLQKGFTIQEDNVMVEFNIPPAFSLESWQEYLVTAMQAVQEYVSTKGPYALRYTSQHKFPHKDMQTEQAMKFGCSPDFNAYTNGGEFEPIDPAELKDKGGQFRFCGGHIHVGYESEVPVWVVASFADYFIGLITVGHDLQEKRRPLYGQPGRYRPTPYGLEYRTPSNYWLRDMHLMYSIGSAAFNLANYVSQNSLSRIRAAYQKMPWGAVRKAITEQDTSLAAQIASYVQEESLMPATLPPEELE